MNKLETDQEFIQYVEQMMHQEDEQLTQEKDVWHKADKKLRLKKKAAKAARKRNRK